MRVQIDPIQVGDAASPNLWNSRLGKITEAINGNIDSDNLKDNGVTREKLAAGSVSSDKLDVDKYIDDNGWTVIDFGSTKTYRLQVSGTINIGANTGFQLLELLLPQGITNLDTVFFNWSARQQSQEVIYTIFPDPNKKDKILVRAWSTVGVPINNHTYAFDFVIENK